MMRTFTPEELYARPCDDSAHPDEPHHHGKIMASGAYRCTLLNKTMCGRQFYYRGKP